MATFYLHYEGAKGCAFTTKIKAQELDCPLDDVISSFVSKYEISTSSSSSLTTEKLHLHTQCLELRLEDGERLSLMGSTLAECNLSTCGTTDLFVVDCLPRSISVNTSSTTSTIGASSQVLSSATHHISTPPSSTSTSSINIGGFAADSIAKVIKGVKELCDMRAYRKARELVQETMREVQQKGLGQLSSQGHKVTQDCSLHEALAEIFIKTESYDKAVDSAERALEARLTLGPKQSSGSTQRYLNFLLATAHFHAESFEDAWAALQKAVDACNMKKQASTAQTMGRTYVWFHLDVLALQAEILFGLGKHQQAAEVVNSCMSDANCEQHLPVLLAYSHFAAQYGKYEEAIRSLLKIVVLDQTNKRGRRLLARLLDTSTGMTELQSQLPPSENSASAYAFLATICKDHSAIVASRRMLELALQHKPMSASYALNLIHVLELQGDGEFYDAAIRVAEDFLLLNKEYLRVGNRGFSAKQLWSSLQEPIYEEGVDGYVVGWLGERDDAGVEQGVLEPSVQGGCAVTMALRRSGTQESPSFTLDSVDISDTDIHPTASSKEEYDGDALDLLAISFTLVKLLYLRGRLHRLPAVFKVIEPTRRRSQVPIHETTVRNEHAYYQCIAQTLAYRLSCACCPTEDGSSPALSLETMPDHLRSQFEATLAMGMMEGAIRFPVSSTLRDPRAACCDISTNQFYKQAACNPVYMLGDSHTVPAAWNIIHLATPTGKMEPRLVVPKLVTGLKQYHLRKDSDFYPKAQFAQLLKTIPDGSDVIFTLGEIDCREGILVGIQKDCYDSVRQGMETTITHFAQVLPNLLKQRKMRVNIHPVLPMLNETRQMVCTFNEHYRRIMQSINMGHLRWLDFFDQLLSSHPVSQLQLRTGLRMDGTHITPAYMSLIETAMQA